MCRETRFHSPAPMITDRILDSDQSWQVSMWFRLVNPDTSELILNSEFEFASDMCDPGGLFTLRQFDIRVE